VLDQATAASMPRHTDPDATLTVRKSGQDLLVFNGTAHHLVAAGAASTYPMHKSAGFTCAFVFRPDAAAAGVDTVIDTCNAANGSHGICVQYDAANAQIVVKVANGSGTWVIDKGTGAATVAANVWHRVAITWSAAGGVSIRINDAAAVTEASVGAASANDATATLQLGRRSGGADFLHAEIGALIYIIGAKTDANMLKWLKWAKKEYVL
jgi:hypothetical protein